MKRMIIVAFALLGLSAWGTDGATCGSEVPLPATIHLTSDGANLSNFVLDGRFTATEPGTIIVDGAALPKVKHDDFVFATVGGCDDAAALSRWRVEGDAIPKGWSAQLVLVDGNRLAVRLFAAGLLILVD
ncbi:MAG: hypothetical protein J6334_07615 [Kiritimatiellae bacterium]|nr:hypothetical protein [Kiritimatiellia bacterium]